MQGEFLLEVEVSLLVASSVDLSPPSLGVSSTLGKSELLSPLDALGLFSPCSSASPPAVLKEEDRLP